jgi:hypothetical protein
MRKISPLLLGGLLIVSFAPYAFSQTANLIDAAKKEGGKVIVYTSMETFTADALKKAFESKTGRRKVYS